MLESRAQHMAAIYAHISQLELLSLRCLLESEVSVPRSPSPPPQPSAAILLLSDRLKTTNLLPYLRSGFGIMSTICLSGYSRD